MKILKIFSSISILGLLGIIVFGYWYRVTIGNSTPDVENIMWWIILFSLSISLFFGFGIASIMCWCNKSDKNEKLEKRV